LEWTKDDFLISDDPSLLDVDMIHTFLTQSYWAKRVPKDVVEKAIQGSLNFGVYQGNRQVGYARAITDKATFAYLADIFVLSECQRHGLGKWLMECIIGHPDLQGLRRMMLATKDAQTYYQRYGFRPLSNPDRLMEILVADIYQRAYFESEGEL